MKKRLVQAGICIGLLLAVTALVPGYNEIAARVERIMGTEVLLLDPGHGGIDGGAVSGQGVSEKAINLAISQEVKEMAEAAGWQVVMTRDEDEGLYEEGSGAIRSLKTQDLKARRELIQKTKPELAVSIHLNSFKEDPSVHGMQLFYPGSGGEEKVLEKSKLMAETLQETVALEIKNDKKRVPLPKSDVFLFKDVTCPITIIECGFLSNPNEAQLLQSEEYQQKLAKGIFDGITRFTGKKPKKNVEIIKSSENTKK